MRPRHVVLALLALLSVITYLDRICITVAGPRMQDELKLSPTDWSWVLNAFIIAYGVFEIPTGAMGDRRGHRRVLTRIVVWWSAFTSLTGAARSFGGLVGTRFLFGAGEAGAYPNISGVISRWFPLGERARAQGIVWAASRVGGALSPLLVVPLLAWIGWRGTFVAFGGLGVVWAIGWYAWYRDPSANEQAWRDDLCVVRGPRGGGPSTDDIRNAAEDGVPWAKLFRSRQLWLVMAMYWSYVWGSIFYLGWFPTYLVRGRGLTETEMGVYASLPFILGVLGNVLGGRVGDWLVQRFGLSLGRRLMGSTCLLLSALCLVLTAATTGKTIGVVLLALGFGIMDCMLPSAWALPLDLGGRYSGAVSGAMNTAGSAGGFVCTWLFGQLVAASGDYSIPIFVIAGMVGVAACLFWLIDPTRTIFAEASDE